MPEIAPWIATACGLAMTNKPAVATAPSAIASEAQQSAPSVIASEARQSMPEIASWIATACGLAMTNLHFILHF